MKGFLSLILVVLVFITSAMAEGLDLEGMDYDSLMKLKQAVDDELYSRPEAEPRVLYPGMYTVGQDIKAGSYQVIVAEVGDDETGSEILVYSDLTSKEAFAEIQDAYVGISDSPISIILENGNVIEVCWLPAKFSVRGFDSEDYPDYALPEGTIVPSGAYVVGDDIPSGMYQMFAGSISDGKLLLYSSVEAYNKDKSSRLNYDEKYELEASKTASGFMIRLDEGNVVIVEQDVIMKKQQKLRFD